MRVDLINIPKLYYYRYYYHYSILDRISRYIYIYTYIYRVNFYRIRPRKFQARERRGRRRGKEVRISSVGRLDAGQGVSVHAAVIARGECN